MEELGSLENTVVSMDMIRETPSYLKGFSHKLERDVRVHACLWIRTATIMLKLPHKTAATAQVILQRFYFQVSIGSIPLFDLIGGCIYLASKLEESPKRLRDIITVLYYLSRKIEVSFN
jgi:surface polysaccharide O-acyltransferase-like enzyme